MSLRYRQRLFLYFSVVFTAFSIGIVVVEQAREKTYKTEALEEKLEAYTDIIHAKLVQKGQPFVAQLKDFQQVLPADLRVTLINSQGKVLYDNSVDSFLLMENHAERVEIKQALSKGKGSEIRASETKHQEYLYYAKRFGDNYIRVALPYDIQLQAFLKPDNAFLYFMLAFFATFILIIHLVTFRFGKTIKQLRDFVLQPDQYENNKPLFPNDELGEIGAKITDNYFHLKKSRSAVLVEKQKLLQHIQISEEGICFLSATNEVEFYNGLFIQFINGLTDEPTSEAAVILTDPLFVDLQQFIASREQNYFETHIHKHGKTFSLKANIFDDTSFEVILSDITKQEKTKQLKQEMTGNIAHELRTPITSIRGYLETILEQATIPEDKKTHFIQQAYNQSIVLSEIIRDMSLIAKIEEGPNSFVLEDVNLTQLFLKLKEEVSETLELKKSVLNWQIPADLIIQGNASLLYSLFRNLTDNALRYAGEGVSININLYNQDADFYYFTFQDNGIGIQEEQHLNRLFERFYRVNEGRTRESGGSGLGLSIVRNAVAFHKGKISVKNRKEGGLEFLFSLRK
ncbi:MAG: ATP-binding protein [Crocinitomicaceae bacterium]|nr:ATP-binding protein [Crocinitomicaceae bacterium]